MKKFLEKFMLFCYSSKKNNNIICRNNIIGGIKSVFKNKNSMLIDIFIDLYWDNIDTKKLYEFFDNENERKNKLENNLSRLLDMLDIISSILIFDELCDYCDYLNKILKCIRCHYEKSDNNIQKYIILRIVECYSLFSGLHDQNKNVKYKSCRDIYDVFPEIKNLVIKTYEKVLNSAKDYEHTRKWLYTLDIIQQKISQDCLKEFKVLDNTVLPDEVRCQICLNVPTHRLVSCQHYVCDKCFISYFIINKTVPKCCVCTKYIKF
jgi:hypothetical protein